MSRRLLGIGVLTSFVLAASTGLGAAPAKQSTQAENIGESVGRQYDLVIYGATPGGVACAIRVARQGLHVLLVSHSDHAGGMLVNGLSTMDTLYNGARAPVYDELRMRIHEFYRDRYGVDSLPYLATQPGHPKTRYEAHVVERLIDDLLAAETRITILKRYYPVAVTQESAMLRSVTFQQMDGEERLMASADVFADCSYEADLAAVTGVPCRVGRESRDEFNEKHAGVIFMRRMPWPPRSVDIENLSEVRRLNLYRYDAWYETMSDAGTSAADPAVQGFNMRTIITNDSSNRVIPEKPQDYDPELFRKFGFGHPQHPGLSMPNRKFGMNEPKLVGEQDRYVEGDWRTRRAVTRQHRDAALGLLYFRQHDSSVPESIRAEWQEYGLPRDEFVDNGHMPYEVYARETRRIRGRAVFTENDAQLAVTLSRAPVHSDSISMTEWFLDSHACTPRQVDGSELEGMVMLKNQTFPGQLSYRTILPEGHDNLLVPVCVSSTHVGWGTIRLEPTWMSICEAAGFAIAMAKRQGVTPAEIDDDALVRVLAEHRVMVSFFNDVEGHADAKWYPAVQYLGTQGYFGSYDARPNDLLTSTLAGAWAEQFRRQLSGVDVNPTEAAQRIRVAEQKNGSPVAAHKFARQLEQAAGTIEGRPAAVSQLMAQLEISSDGMISRGDACRLIYTATMRQDFAAPRQ
ncbi:MAG: FAD-dependent oxidoreductase [Planctomycetaceae bacterium]